MKRGFGEGFPWKIYGRVFLAHALLLLVGLLAVGFFTHRFVREQFREHAEAQLRETVTILSKDLSSLPGSDWCQRHVSQTTLRFTLIREDGTVLCDSHHDAATMENHADRPEVIEARKGGLAQSLRLSRTLDESFAYGALWLPVPQITLRVAVALSRVDHSLALFDRSLLLLLALVGISLALVALWSARQIVSPVERLLKLTRQLARRDPEAFASLPLLQDESPSEWAQLEATIEGMHRSLEDKSESLNLERGEVSTLMSAISDAILAVDKQGMPLFFNSRFAVIFGSGTELLKKGARLEEIVRSPEILEAYDKALAQGLSSHVKALTIEGGAFAHRFYSLSVSPLRRGDAEVYGAVGILHDVTELKMSEQIRIDFVANVSHELRTPLTAIKGYVETLREDAGAGRAMDPEFLHIIGRHTDRLMHLIHDLLELSWLDSGQKVLTRTPIDTAELTQRVSRQLEARLTEKRHRIVTLIEASEIAGEPGRLEQVLVNLLENAINYTQPGGELRVEWLKESDHVVLKVHDNGPGIPAEHIDRLFERFYRVDRARSRHQGGTGLGLAIVKHIVQRHEGQVSVESLVGRGSTFICRFPASDRDLARPN